MKRSPAILIAVLVLQFLPCRQAEAGCTIGVASGAVTVDDRPLLWKSRMLYNADPNEVAYFSASPYDYIAVSG